MPLNPMEMAMMARRTGPTNIGAVPPVYNPIQQATVNNPSAPANLGGNVLPMNNNFGTGDPGIGVPGPQAPADPGLASSIGLATTALGGLVSPAPASTVGLVGAIANALSPGLTSNSVSVNGLSTNNVGNDVPATPAQQSAIVGPTSVLGAIGMGIGTQGMGPPGVAAGQALGQAIASQAENSGGPGGAGPGAAAGDSAASGAAAAFKKGGKVPGPQGMPLTATVHGGEYIINAKTAMEYGTKYLDKLNKQKIKKK